MKIDGFEWDAGNHDKCQSHGVSIVDIEGLFSRPHLIAPDVKHSHDEERYVAIGRSAGDRPLFVVFTTREEGDALLVRHISARYMHAKEFKRYER
ncbi:BrnT family toxin [Devosia sp. SL43]|uniref:BrnT family toxin n=1 Tax=Devosia sp. SL43 TaxID=2806348 RepID=UPI001F1E8D8C|nr:BrnT family toxin [Devosia sp. SL43]UJW84460.1 BrnT family toxin [Devosia sp. SL43]